jgi:hypothetical protein
LNPIEMLWGYGKYCVYIYLPCAWWMVMFTSTFRIQKFVWWKVSDCQSPYTKVSQHMWAYYNQKILSKVLEIPSCIQRWTRRTASCSGQQEI